MFELKFLDHVRNTETVRTYDTMDEAYSVLEMEWDDIVSDDFLDDLAEEWDEDDGKNYRQWGETDAYGVLQHIDSDHPQYEWKVRERQMFKTFESFADFDGCTKGQHLWCFDCWTKDMNDEWHQNRMWCVSDMPEDETRAHAEEYAKKTYKWWLQEVNFFDPSGPEIDFMGNFGEWYASPENKAIFMRACKIENEITDDMAWEERSRLRDKANRLLLDSGVKANMGEIEEVPMWDIIRDVLNKE